MKKRITLMLLFGIIFLSCKEGKKTDEIHNDPDVVEAKTEKVEYEVLADSYANMKVIFDNGFTFTEGITIQEIGVLKTGEDSYKVAYFLDEDSDFEKIKDLNIAFRVYPENPELFKNKADLGSKAKTIASASDIKVMDNIKTIMSDEFSLAPKKFKRVKVYFYTSKDGVLGEMMTILNVQFP